MSDKNILSKVKNREFYLNKLVANRIEKQPKDNKINISQDVFCTILEKTKERLTLKVNARVFVVPEAFFSIETEHVLEVVFREETTDEEIESTIDEIIAPLGTEISFIIASLTKKMFGAHIILPPRIKVYKINK